jgi:hypothetical protein
MDDFTMLDYMKCKSILGGIILDCPARFFLSKHTLWHDLAHGFSRVLTYLRKFEKSESFVSEITEIMDCFLENKRIEKYKDHKDPALDMLFYYGSACQSVSSIFDVLYRFWIANGSIATDEALARIKENSNETGND